MTKTERGSIARYFLTYSQRCPECFPRERPEFVQRQQAPERRPPANRSSPDQIAFLSSQAAQFRARWSSTEKRFASWAHASYAVGARARSGSESSSSDL